MGFPTPCPVGCWVSVSRGLCKWRNRQPTATERRREELDIKVRIAFEMSGRTYGSPRVRAQLRADGEQVSKKTVAASMHRPGPGGTLQTAS